MAGAEMKVVNMPPREPDAKLEERLAETKKAITELANQSQFISYMVVGLNADGSFVASGVHMDPHHMAFAGALLQKISLSEANPR